MKIEDIMLGRHVRLVSERQAHTWEIVSAELLSKGICLGLKRSDSSECEVYFNQAYWFEVEVAK